MAHRNKRLVKVPTVDGTVRYDLVDVETLKDAARPLPGQEAFAFGRPERAGGVRGGDDERTRFAGRGLALGERSVRDAALNPMTRPTVVEARMPRRAEISRASLAHARALYDLGRREGGPELGWERVREVYDERYRARCACGRDGRIVPDPRAVRLTKDDRPVALCDRCLEWRTE